MWCKKIINFTVIYTILHFTVGSIAKLQVLNLILYMDGFL